MIVFLPLLRIRWIRYHTDVGVKYLLIQAIGSIIFLLGCLRIEFWLILGRIILKMGRVPFHFWFPSICRLVNWLGVFMISVWQKLLPLVVFLLSVEDFFSLFFLGLINIIIGGIGGVNLTQFKSLLGFSSISHLGWIFIITESQGCFLLYFIIYIFLFGGLTLILRKRRCLNLSKLNISKYDKIFIVLIIISLAGIPPFVGFMLKWIILQNILFCFKVPFLVFLTIFFTGFILYYYLNILFSIFLSPRDLKISNKINFGVFWRLIIRGVFLFPFLLFFL